MGALLDDLASLGWTCEALETAPQARHIARSVHRDNPRIEIHASPRAEWHERFDLVAAFEVLEHIEDDHGALRTWAGWLRPGGTLLLSVPAHAGRWGATDVWAGHVRRYEREDLVNRVTEAGLRIRRLECYGFPLANVFDPLRNRMHRAELRSDRGPGAREPTAATARSGVERPLESRLFRLQAHPPGSWIVRGLLRAQGLFLDREWGNGYLLAARKPERSAA